MKKQKKQLIFLVILLVVLCGAYFGAEAYNKHAEQKEAEAELAGKKYLVQVDAADITAISYDYNEEICSFVKEEEVWVAENDKTLSIKQSSLESMAEKLAVLEVQDVVEGVTDLEQYGLTEPAKTIQFIAGDTEYEILQGTYNPTASVYYVCDASDLSVVYTVQTTALISFNHGMDSLVETAEVTE